MVWACGMRREKTEALRVVTRTNIVGRRVRQKTVDGWIRITISTRFGKIIRGTLVSK